MATVVSLSPAAQSMATHYPVGKLPSQALARLLAAHVDVNVPGMLVGPAVGEDAAAIDLGDDCLVVASDPITFATDAIGHYVVHVNANDVATMGARPRWFLVTVLLPEKSSDALVEEIFSDVSAACLQVGAALCGGHTEICADLARPLLIGTMMGTVARDKLLQTGAARPGDRIWCTKRIPLEAAALMARERPEWARAHLGASRWRRCADLLDDPGISVVPEAMAAAGAGARCLHDPTEGGVATGLHELADAAGVGLEIDVGALPMDADGVALCSAADVNPLGALASGALLIVGPEESGAAIEAAVSASGVDCRLIGEIRPAAEGRGLVSGTEKVELPAFAVDEIGRWLRESS